ncbi:MAG: diadenylate cyclase CdaA [Chloroflexota bacterium]
MPTSESIFSDFLFSLANITVTQVLDIILVTVVFYLLLHLLRRSRATVLLRGTLVLIALFFIVTVFLPLPTFDYILELALLATLIATPIIFQPELRHLLEELGRRVGSLRLRRMAAETTLKPLVRAIESLSERNIGALVVVEGNDELGDIMQTGVPMGSEVTSELVQTIFYDGTPLHDGAIIIRGNRLVAAGCVLPVSNRQLYAGQRRLGTRHRAAVGLTETSDALVLVVSEETGAISVARHGELQSGLDRTALREQIHSFFQSEDAQQEEFSLSVLAAQIREWWRSGSHFPRGEDLLSDLFLLLVAGLLALATWTFVARETNPVQQVRIEDISLRVVDVPPRMQLIDEPPEAIAAVVKAPNAMLESLGPGSFEAQVSLEDLEPGLHRLPVEVESSVQPVQVTNVEPEILDIRLAGIVSRTVEVRPVTVGQETLSPALEISNSPNITPTEVLVSGAAPTVDEVDRVLVEISIPNTTGAVQRTLPVVAVDQDGEALTGIDVEPDQVQVGLTVARRTNAREVGVRVVTEGEIPEGFRLTRMTVDPPNVTLLGAPEQLEEVGNALATFAVDLSQAVDDFSVQVPLDLPPGIEAVDPQGRTTRSAQVRVEVAERASTRVYSRSVEVLGSVGLQVLRDPPTVDVTVNGPVPMLNQIEEDPNLLRVVIEASELADMNAGDSMTVTPQILVPEELQARIVPETITVTVQ